MWNLLEEIRGILFPKVCPLCKERLCAEAEELCSDCLQTLPQLPKRICPGCGGPNDNLLGLCSECVGIKGGRPWTRAVSCFPFHGTLRTAIHQYKYRGRHILKSFFAKAMIDNWRKQCGDMKPDAVTYIPLHFIRHLRRGYNQSELLAQAVAKELGIPCVRMLRRVRYTRPQASLNMEGRLVNLKGAYKLRSVQSFIGKKVLLIDDVFTTGTTLSLATTLLQNAGVGEVYVMTIARD